MKNNIIFVFVSHVLLFGQVFAEAQPPIRGRILIDPGHGGGDSGMVADNGLLEKEVNLKVSRYLQKLLTRVGFEVEMTRSGDETLSLGARVEHAKKFKPDLFLSIHHNSTLGNRNIQRTEIYYKSTDECRSLQVGLGMAKSFSNFFPQKNPALLEGNYFVLRNNPFPALLGEAAYLSHHETAKTFKRGERMALTEAAHYFKALTDYFKLAPVSFRFLNGLPEKIAEGLPTFGLQITGPFDFHKTHFFLKNQMTQEVFPLTSRLVFHQELNLFSPLFLKDGNYRLEVRGEDLEGRRLAEILGEFAMEKPISSLVFETPLLLGGEQFGMVLHFLDSGGNPSLSFKGGQKIKAVFSDGKVEILQGGKGPTLFKGSLNNVPITFETEEGKIFRFSLPPLGDLKRGIEGKVTHPEREDLSGIPVSFWGGAETATHFNGQFLLPLPSTRLPKIINCGPIKGFFTQWLDLSTRISGTPVSFTLEKNTPPLSSVMLDFNFSQKEIFYPLWKAFQILGNYSGVTLQTTHDSDFPRTIQERVRFGNQNPTNYFFSLRQSGSGGPFQLRHYPKSSSGKKMGELLQNHLRKRGFSAVLNPGSDYPLTNTTAAALVIEGDFETLFKRSGIDLFVLSLMGTP